MADTDAQNRPAPHVFVIDDEPLAVKNLRRILEKAGHKVSTFTNPLRALKRMEQEPCDLVISDIKMPYMDGLSLLNRAKRLVRDIEVILISGYASLDGAVEATKQGAFHYLAKPFSPDQLRDIVSEALRDKFLKEASAHHEETQKSCGIESVIIIGRSPKMVQVEALIRQIAPTECNVFITGESGTGKELAARSIHGLSSRAKGPFMAFNCGAFSEELIANELFGHEKEAFTGASSRKPGLLESANKGTLFLDEIGDMPHSMLVEMTFPGRPFLGSERKSIQRLESRIGETLGNLSTDFLKEGISVSVALRIGNAAHEFLKFLAERPPFQAVIWGSSEDLPDGRQAKRSHWMGKVADSLECPLLAVYQ